MGLAIKSVSTQTMGETTAGAAIGATKAALNVTGASSKVSDYQGVSFVASVNGVNKTVTLPVASNLNVGGATNAATPLIADSKIDMTSSGQVGGFDQKTMDLSTAGAPGIVLGTLLVTLNGSGAQKIDISSATNPSYYKTAARATGGEIVTALQTELDKNAAFQGANKLKVSMSSAGRIQIALASGASGVISVGADGALAGAATATLWNTLNNSAGVTGTDTSNTGALEIGGKTVSLVGNTSFDVGSNHFDISAASSARGYDLAKLTADQFIEVYNATAKVNGVQVSSAVKSTALGNIDFIGTSPTAPLNSNFNNGSLLTSVTVANGATATFLDAAAGKPFGEFVIATRDATNNTINLALGSNTVGADIKLQTVKPFQTMADVAAGFQAAINATGAFTGDNAITVTATMDTNKRMGLTFSNVAGQQVKVSGNFLTAYTGLSGGVAGVTFGASTAPTSVVSYDPATTKVNINGATQPSGVGVNFAEKTQSLETVAKRSFTLNVNGGGNIALDLSTAVTNRGYKSTAITGTQLVNVINDTIAASGSFTGNNAVVASLTPSGQIALQVAGGPVGGGNPSATIASAAGGFVGTLTLFNDGTQATTLSANSNGNLALTTAGDKEKFGIADLAVSASRGNNRVTLAIGSGNPISFDIASGNYTNANALVAEINTKIAQNGLFTGANAVTASVNTDATTGLQSVGFSSTNGKSVTFTGALAVQMKSTTVPSILSTYTVAGALTGSAATANDTLKLDYNGVTYTATIGAAVAIGDINTAIAAAVDSNGNALGANKLNATASGGGADLVLTLDQTTPSTANVTDVISNITYSRTGAAFQGKETLINVPAAASIAGDKLRFTFNDVAYTATVAGTATTADWAAAVNLAVDQSGNALGAGKVTGALAGGNLTLVAAAAGNSVSNASYQTKANFDLASVDTVYPAARVPSGGVNLSSDNKVSMSVTDASGVVTTKTLTLGSSDSSVTFSKYADLMKAAANTAFADKGFTFSASYANGKFSLTADQPQAAALKLSGASVTAAFGGDFNATAPVQVKQFVTMTDVASAINEDLAGVATAAYDAKAGWTFTASTGNDGPTSSISLSGAGLATVQIGGTLAATGIAGNATASKLSDINVLTTASATAALGSIDNSIEYVNKQRSLLGAIENRLSYAVNNLTNIVTNTQASRSAIEDTDYSKETTALAKQQIITQAATAMLAQANQSSQSVLSLLK